MGDCPAGKGSCLEPKLCDIRGCLRLAPLTMAELLDQLDKAEAELEQISPADKGEGG